MIRRFLLPFFAVILVLGCTHKKQTAVADDAFADAKWIAFEQLEDSMKVVPAIHGTGDGLGNKCVKRSVVPLMNFTIPENATARIIIPEAYQKAKCIVRDLTKNKIIDVNIIRGGFEIASGKYVVMAN